MQYPLHYFNSIVMRVELLYATFCSPLLFLGHVEIHNSKWIKPNVIEICLCSNTRFNSNLFFRVFLSLGPLPLWPSTRRSALCPVFTILLIFHKIKLENSSKNRDINENERANEWAKSRKLILWKVMERFEKWNSNILKFNFKRDSQGWIRFEN